MVSDELLRRDVRVLGEMLGQIIREQAGLASLELVERIRLLSRERRYGSNDAETLLTRLVQGLTDQEARVVARAFSIFFDVANIAEDRHRVRVLREREFQAQSEPISESILSAIAELKLHGCSATQVGSYLKHMTIDLVFTAHPSEAKRRSIRAKLRRMRYALQELDRSDLLPRERQSLTDSIRGELSVLWQTEFLHPNRPEVLDEVERGVATLTRLWDVVPDIFQAVRRALERYYPEELDRWEIPPFLRFGFWMGGDRDGNPHVTWQVTAKTLCRLRQATIALHLDICARMFGYLTISLPLDSVFAQRLQARIEFATTTWPATAPLVETVDSGELYRRWLKIIQWRLQKSLAVDILQPLPDGAFRDSDELLDDLLLLQTLLGSSTDILPVKHEIQRWIDGTRTFGLYGAQLDIRQDAKRYQEILSEILAACQICDNYMSLSETARCEILTSAMEWNGVLPEDHLAPLTLDTLRLYTLLHAVEVQFGSQCLGGSIISLTRSASDVLGVLWLWKVTTPRTAASMPRSDGHHSLVGRHSPEEHRSGLRMVPLFEQIEDLRHAPETLGAILDHPTYAKYLEAQGKRQLVMIGYSDSTKDGGYLAATWGLYQAQNELHSVAAARGVDITFFHGRGGALGRGGGPAARGILSLPPRSLDGTLRLTEQGEVLAERYDDSQIAFRHLEQVFWAVLTGHCIQRPAPPGPWQETMAKLAAISRDAYRKLVDTPGFMRYFELASPIEEIENLPIASRPSRRRGERSLAYLRAIPWVFAWTQNRCLIPAWYGLGESLQFARRDASTWELLKNMYAEWTFFQAMIDNASLALAKADMYVAERYAELQDDLECRAPIWSKIRQEFERTRLGILDLTDRDDLLANIPWFARSIEARNPYVDPLNLIQIEFLRRSRELISHDAQDPATRDLLRLTVQGIAAGMRTTG